MVLWGERELRGREPVGPLGQSLPDRMRPTARAAPEKKAGARLALQDAEKGPHCPLSPFRSPRKKIRDPIPYSF